MALSLLTLALVSITWVFFRAPDFGKAMLILVSMFGIPEVGAKMLPTIEMVKVAVVIGGLYLHHLMLRESSLEQVIDRTPQFMRALIWAGMLVLIVVSQGGGDAFIYFQF